MTVDSIRLPEDVKLYARDDTGPLRQQPWPTVAFLVDEGLISDGSCTSDHGSESGLDHGTESDSNFSDFLERDDTVPNLESGTSDCSQTPIRSNPASYLSRGKKFRKKVKFRQFFERPKFEPFLHPFVCVSVVPPGSGRGHPLHGCGGAVAVREKGQGGGRGGGAGEGEAAPGGRAGSRGSGGGAEVGQPQPRADADGRGLRVATATTVCAAAGMEGARDGRGVDGGGSGGAGPLREVGGEDEGKAGEEGDPPLQRPGRQGREGWGKGA